jgi:hypothetical protein
MLNQPNGHLQDCMFTAFQFNKSPQLNFFGYALSVLREGLAIDVSVGHRSSCMYVTLIVSA